MSLMIEVFLAEAQSANRADVIAAANGALGRVSFEETNEGSRLQKGVCLTFDFSFAEQAQQAAKLLAAQGFHVEGPYDY